MVLKILAIPLIIKYTSFENGNKIIFFTLIYIIIELIIIIYCIRYKMKTHHYNKNDKLKSILSDIKYLKQYI